MSCSIRGQGIRQEGIASDDGMGADVAGRVSRLLQIQVGNHRADPESCVVTSCLARHRARLRQPSHSLEALARNHSGAMQ